jgi:hypothetical protein
VININRLRAIGPWFAEGRHVWIAIGITAVALIICLRPGATERCIRLTGLALQLLGVGTVIWGISVTRNFFGHKPILVTAKNWLRRFPLLKQHHTLAASGITLSGLVGNARAHGTHGAGVNPSLEARIAALERNITAIHERITDTQRELDQRFRKADEVAATERMERVAEDQKLRGMLEATATGGIHISAIGAVWLFFGVILSTAAPELSYWLR